MTSTTAFDMAAADRYFRSALLARNTPQQFIRLTQELGHSVLGGELVITYVPLGREVEEISSPQIPQDRWKIGWHVILAKSGEDMRYNPAVCVLSPSQLRAWSDDLERAMAAMQREQLATDASNVSVHLRDVDPMLSLESVDGPFGREKSLRVDIRSSTGFRFGWSLREDQVAEALWVLRRVPERAVDAVLTRERGR